MDSNLLEEKIYSIDEKKTRIAIMSVMILSLLGRRFCLSLEKSWAVEKEVIQCFNIKTKNALGLSASKKLCLNKEI